MIRKIALLAVLLAYFGPIARAAPVYATEQFEYACQFHKEDCSGIKPPMIVFVPLYMQRGWLGFYSPQSAFWRNTIFIDSEVLLQMDERFIFAIIAHEATHYMDYQLGRPMDNPCEVEGRGWATSNSYLVAAGLWGLANWKWQENYSGC